MRRGKIQEKNTRDRSTWDIDHTFDTDSRRTAGYITARGYMLKHSRYYIRSAMPRISMLIESQGYLWDSFKGNWRDSFYLWVIQPLRLRLTL